MKSPKAYMLANVLILQQFHCVDSEAFSGRNQSIGCAVAWVTIARDSECEYPFHPVGQLYRVRTGHIWCQMCSRLTNLRLSVSSDSYCTSVGSRVYSNTLATLFTHYPTVWTVKCSVVRTRVLAVLQRGLLKHATLNPNTHSILWGNSAGFGQATYLLPFSRWGDYVAIGFLITLQFLLTDGTEQMQAIRSACSRTF